MTLQPHDEKAMRLTALYNRASPVVREGVNAMWETPKGKLDALMPRICEEARNLYHAREDYADALMKARGEEARRLNGGVNDFPTYSRLYDARWGASAFAPGAWA
jgi:hypothetical protein